MEQKSRVVVITSVLVIAIVAVAAVLLRNTMRCAGFPGGGISAADLPSSEPQPGNIRIAVWNIRNFPIDERPQNPDLGYSRLTNICDLEDALRGLDADVFALNEICDTRRFPPILQRAGAHRAYQLMFAGGAGRFGQHAGVAWDEHRVEPVGAFVEIDEVAFDPALRSALATYLRSSNEGGVDFTLVSVHLAAAPKGYESRLRQYRALARWVNEWVTTVGDEDVIVAGDFNTAGKPGGTSADELVVADRILGRAGLTRLPNTTGCTQYWEGRDRKSDGIQIASSLDHVYIRSLEELDASVPLEAWLHCRRMACEDLESRAGAEDATFWDISDHCPLTFEIVDRDLDG